MEMWIKYIAVAVVSYLLGSLNFAIIFSKIFMKKDVRQYGSGNAGSTNAYRMMGGKKTLLVMLGDVLKGIAAVVVAGIVFDELGQFGGLGKMIAGASVALGHIFPVYFGFKGGKGVLTIGAVLAFFDIRILAIAFAAFLIGVLITKYVSVGSIAAASAVAVTMIVFHHNDLLTALIGFLLGAFVIWMHRGNIKRLAQGTENKFSFNKKKD